MSPVISLVLWCAFMIGGSLAINVAPLGESFYQKTCPQVMEIAKGVIAKAISKDKTILPGLLLLHFKDCFANGCDASTLLDNMAAYASIGFNSTRGFDVISDIKTQVEKACPKIVSCADLLAISAQIAVAKAGGPQWAVQLGRRDCRTANSTAAKSFTKVFNGTLDQLKALFSSKNLTTRDLVALSGAHTIGTAHCKFFSDRLYNFNGTGHNDWMMEGYFYMYLRDQCPKNGNGSSPPVDLDLLTPYVFDNKYFVNLPTGRGLLRTDQELFSTPVGGDDTAHLVNVFAGDQTAFFESFKEAMIRMGNINVMTGSSGEIRRNCMKVN